MNDLLDSAVAAHGGLGRWNHVKSITVDASITGALWSLKGKDDALRDVRLEVDTTRQLVTIEFAGQDKRSVFEPRRVVIQRCDGALIGAREDPERSFEGHQLQTPWDDIHLAYFTGEALWTYLNTPFLYTWPGFVTEEITPIEAGGETWRRLKVTFPDHIKSHTRQQIFCFGPDGLLRRHDFTIDILGGATGLLYATGYRDVDGIIIPATRRGYAWQGDYQLIPEPLLVAIDMGESDPVDPAATIRGFLDALGVPGQRVPAEPQAQAGLYRSLLAGRRMLIMLDNARDEDQVRPLLPTSPQAYRVRSPTRSRRPSAVMTARLSYAAVSRPDPGTSRTSSRAR
jgi:hypothetical protein